MKPAVKSCVYRIYCGAKLCYKMLIVLWKPHKSQDLPQLIRSNQRQPYRCYCCQNLTGSEISLCPRALKLNPISATCILKNISRQSTPAAELDINNKSCLLSQSVLIRNVVHESLELNQKLWRHHSTLTENSFVMQISWLFGCSLKKSTFCHINGHP